MPLRDFILKNFRWKLIALLLAITVWFFIQPFLPHDIKPTDHSLTDRAIHRFSSHPVMILKAPGDSAVYKVTPSRVEITVRSRPGILNKPSENDIKVFVNLVDVRETVKENKQVFIYGPNRSELNEAKVEPPTVTVERVIPTK